MINKNLVIKNRLFIPWVSILLIGLLLLECTGEKVNNEKQKLPNIVMIISDDQAWGDYGFMGHKVIQTPNLDKLASESLVFRRGYVATPLCGPSLTNIVTGLYTHQHKYSGNDPLYKGKGAKWNAKGWTPERKKEREKMINNVYTITQTLPQRLKELNYSSLQTGKWWLGSYKQGGFTHGMTHGDVEKGGRHGDEGLKIGRETMKPIYDFIDSTKNQPFLIWYAPFLPHSPHNPPERILKKYRDKTESILVARYWANCEWFDETCGELLDYLDKKNITENTIIFYICDNGWIQNTNNEYYAERSKRSPYEGGIRTPIMVKWQGKITPKMDNYTLASAIDLAPTILKAVGLEPSKDMHGVNLLDSKAVNNRKAIFGADFTHDAHDLDNPVSSLKSSYVLEGDWKLILPTGNFGTGTEPELYNIIEDPAETTNLVSNNSEKVKHLKSLIKDWWNEAVTEARF